MANNNDEGVNNNLDSSKDSGLDKSFVGKFVSNIISTTPFSKWFSKETTKNPGEIRRREDIDDDDFSCLLQPVKRAKLSHTERNNLNVNLFESPVSVHSSTSNNNAISTTHVFPKFPEPAPGPSGIKSTKFLEKHTSFPTSSSPVVDNGSDSDSEDFEFRSSIPAATDKHETSSRNSRNVSSSKEPVRTAPKSRSLFTSSNDLSHTRSLFNDRKPKLNSSLSSRRPNFNASTFGSSTFVDRTLSTKTILSSPFYSGKTIYGGASAYEHRFGKSSDDLISHSSRPNSVQIKPVNTVKSTSENSILSKTARRILQTLEQYSTPISDAKKIPIKPREGILSKYVGVSPYTIRERERKKTSTRELQVPSIPDLLQMKQKERLQNSTVSVRKTATTSKSALNQQEYKLRTEDEESSKQKHSNKMKSSVTSSIRQKAQPVETVEEIHLPAVTLPITSLPTFDLVMMSSSSPQQQTKLSKPEKQPQTASISESIRTKKETEKKIVKEEIVNNYTFSKPTVKAQNRKVDAFKCFTFSKPVNKKPKKEVVNFKMPENHAIKPKNNGENIKPATQLVAGSVMDVLGKKTFKATEKWECQTCLVTNDDSKTSCVACEEPRHVSQSSSGFGDKYKVSKDMWECSACMVRNNNSDSACVACTTPKSSAAFENKLKGLTSTSSSSLKVVETCPTSQQDSISVNNSKIVMSTNGTWECETCLIRNKNDLEKCAACETSRKTTLSSFEKFKPSADTWECGTCLIRNKSELVKCAACETPKPGEKQPVENTMTGFSGPKFNFGIKPLEWECKTCLIKNKTELTKCAACEAPKVAAAPAVNSFGDAFKMKSGDWECTSCLVKNKGNASVCVCCGVIKANSSSQGVTQLAADKKPVNSFNFGIDVSSQFTFGIPQAKANSEAKKEEIAAVAPTPTPDEKQTVVTTANSTKVEKLEVPPVTSTSTFDFKIPSASSSMVKKVQAPVNNTGHLPEPTFQFKPSNSVNGETSKNLFAFGQTPPVTSQVASSVATTSSSLPTLKFEKTTTTTAPPPYSAGTFTNPPMQSTFQVPSSHPDAFKYFKPKEPPAPLFSNEPKQIEQASTFKFGSKPTAPADQSSTSSTTTESNLFKFTASTPASSNVMKRSFGDADKSNLNGFGSAAKLPSFGNSQGFGGGISENQSFAFSASGNSAAAVPKPNFSFGQINKPNNNSIGASNPGFSFGSNAPSVQSTSVGFDFSNNSLPNTGFDFSGSNGKTEAAGGSSLNPQSSRENMFRSGAKNCTFNFGGNANNNNQKAIFSFGASQTAPQPSTPATFNFGPSTALPAQPSGFSFIGAPPPTYSFTEGSSSMAQPQQRKIRKAIRRTPR